jgi:hypothetical protein
MATKSLNNFGANLLQLILNHFRQCGRVRIRSIRASGPLQETVKGKVIPVPFFNQAPRHEGVLGERKYGSTHS